MALEAFMDSRYSCLFSSMTSAHMSGDSVQSSNSDSQQKEDQLQAVVASLFSSSSGNVPGISANIPRSNLNVVSATTNPTISNSLTNLRLNIGAGVNSATLRGPANMDHLSLPAFPSLSSHNSSIAVSPVTSDSSIVQQDSHAGQNCSRTCKRKRQKEAIGAKSQLGSQKHWSSLLNAEKQEIVVSNEMHNRPRLDIKQDAVLHQHDIQPLLQSQGNKQLQGHSSALEALIQQRKPENQKQQKILQSAVPELLGVDLKKQRQHEMRDYLQQLAMQDVHHIHLLNGNVCSRRLTQYMYHLQHRPPDNGIAYWRKFVAEYYAPCAKKRWCLSLCDNFTPQAICVFPRAAVGTWQCGLCRTKCGRGFEVPAEVLPWLNKIQFDSGVIDELLYLELPRECRHPSGLMTLEYEKAVHETVFNQLRVVREGKLRVIFTLDLKILSWEFCSHNHEELLSRSSIASQIHEFVHAAQKFQMTINGCGSNMISANNLEENHNLLLSTACNLQRNLDLQLVGELGFSKRYNRCLQIADALNSMKDLMTFCWENKIGPIESLRNYSQKITSTKFKKDEYEEKKHGISQGMPSDPIGLLSTFHGLGSNKNDSSNTSKDGLLTSSEKSALMHADNHWKLLSQHSVNSNVSKCVELSSLCKGSNQYAFPKPFQSSNTLISEFSQNLPLSRSHFPEGNRRTQDLVIQKLLQEMVNNSKPTNWAEKEPVEHIMNDVIDSMPTYSNGTGSFGNIATSENSTSVGTALLNAPSSIMVKNNGFQAACNREISKDISSSSVNKMEPTLQETLHLPEIQNLYHGLYENEISNSTRGSNMNYGWEA